MGYRGLRRAIVAGVALAATATAYGEKRDSGISVEAFYKADAVAVMRGGLDRGARLLGNAELIAEADLDTIAGWRGGRAKVHLLGVHGGAPNDLAGTIQGIDNIEAPHDRLKLYEIWVEQSVLGDRASLQAGMVDLNAEFYQTNAAGLLIAPAFGIGSEISATGPNGPSIFPSTALAARLRLTPGKSSYVQAALFNAKAGVLGDRGGVDLAMRDGALAIAEAGVTGTGKLALGGWRYTKKQPDVRALDLGRRVARGVYVLGEQRLFGGGDGERQLDAFVRVGVSDGDTSPFRGGAQAGIHVSRPLSARPDSQLSFGVNRAFLSRKSRANARDEGVRIGRAETGLELTYSDQLLPFLAVQPDLQYVRNPSADRNIKDAVIVGLRITIAKPTD